MKPLTPPDSLHLQAALGWLGLGSPGEARVELQKIAAPLQRHPDVLEVQWEIHARAENWDAAFEAASAEHAMRPEFASTWIHKAYAMRRMKGGGLAKAREILIAASEKFPREPMIHYNLACYACQLGEMDAALKEFSQATKFGNAGAFKQLALDDPDLEPLWQKLQ